MSNFEFLAYKPTPTDKYILGLATVKLYGRIVLVFKHVKNKEGNSTFFSTPSYSIENDDGTKRYVQSVMIDSRAEESMLQDFIRENVKRFEVLPKPKHMDEVAQLAEGFPF